MKSKIFLYLSVIALFWSSALLRAEEDPPPLLSLGGGFWDAGENHSGWVGQAEYKFGHYFWWRVRPQTMLVVPNGNSFFWGAGIGVDLYLCKHLVIFPNFAPGFYYQGSGRNLGCPLEFRSGIDFAVEMSNAMRIGCQLFHISNASISDRNPGANAFIFFVALPL